MANQHILTLTYHTVSIQHVVRQQSYMPYKKREKFTGGREGANPSPQL